MVQHFYSYQVHARLNQTHTPAKNFPTGPHGSLMDIRWTNKGYRSHRTLPDSILKELDEKQITQVHTLITYHMLIHLLHALRIRTSRTQSTAYL